MDINNYDIIVIHGGNPISIFDDIKKNKLEQQLKSLKNKTIIGISAGSMLLCKKSLFIKDNIEFNKNILNKDLLGLVDIDRIDCHFNQSQSNKIYMNSLNIAAKSIHDENIFLLSDYSFIKISQNIELYGDIYQIQNNKLQQISMQESTVLTEEITEYKGEFLHSSDQYKMDDISLRVNHEGTNCVIYFNDMLDEQVLNESSNPNSKLLRRLLYDERIRNNKEAFLLYDDIKKDLPWITKTYIDYKYYHGLNLFVDWSYYTQSFFKNNIYKLDKGIDLYFDFVNRFLEDKIRIK
jgi:glutamine amidotransferase PdxT